MANLNIKQVFDANPITSNNGTDLMYFGLSPYGATDDAAMLFSDFAAQFGGPFTAGAGTGSAIGGTGCTAAGSHGFAMGDTNAASGANAVAFGNNNTASGDNSFCSGEFSTASGADSVAMGFFAQAQKANTFAFGTGNTSNPPNDTTGAWTIGVQNSATGSYSFALGCRSASAFQGSWMISDSTGAFNPTVFPAPTAADQFVSMFLGGHYFYNANDASTGLAVNIDANGNLINLKGVANQSVSYQTPTTGFSITVTDYTETLQLTPAGTLATGTVTMPANAVDGQIVEVASTQTVTACTFSANAGQSMLNAPTTLNAGTSARFRYRLSNTTWYAIPGAAAAGISNGGIGANQVLLGSSSTTAVSSSSFTFVPATFKHARGNNVSITNTGSTVIGDSDPQSASLTDSTSDQFNARYQGGYRFFINSNVMLQITNGFIIPSNGFATNGISYVTPTDGFSNTIGNAVMAYIVDPAGALTSGTITMPASPVNGMLIDISITQAITTLTVAPNSGQSIKNAPTTWTGGGFRYIYRISNNTWYRLA